MFTVVRNGETGKGTYVIVMDEMDMRDMRSQIIANDATRAKLRSMGHNALDRLHEALHTVSTYKGLTVTDHATSPDTLVEGEF